MSICRTSPPHFPTKQFSRCVAPNNSDGTSFSDLLSLLSYHRSTRPGVATIWVFVLLTLSVANTRHLITRRFPDRKVTTSRTGVASTELLDASTHTLSRYHRLLDLSPTGTLALASLAGPEASNSRSFSSTWQKMPGATDSTTRFSSRVADYVSSRPSYPPEVVSLLSSHFNLPQNATIVDIGSGTGISSRLLLDRLKEKEVHVVGVEPNKEMRLAGHELLSDYTDSGAFSSRDGTAEHTGLPDDSVDLVVAAQAFHWFNVPKAREECQRILKKSGTSGVALIWNERLGVEPSTGDSGEFPQLDNPVMSAYDLLLVRRAKDYEKVSHHKTVDEDVLKAFFGPEGFNLSRFSNPYRLDFEQLKGRLLSSSYTPQEGDEGYDAMMKELRDLFEKYQNGGKIDFLYDTNVFYGALS